MKKFTYQIRNFFGFSELETKGFVFLLILMAISVFLPSVFQLLYPSSAPRAHNAALLDSLWVVLEQDTARTSRYAYSKFSSGTKPTRKIYLQAFDPNEASLETLLALGFSQKTAARLINYRNKGGKFRKKSDLQKIYGVSEQLYQSLEPYISLPRNTQETKSISQNRKNFQKKDSNENNSAKFQINLNIADTATFKKIPGIGNVLSLRIVGFREKLGGFVNPEQIREVYGLKKEIADKLLANAVLGDYPIRQININRAELAELKQHPYLSDAIARAIVNYRKQHGDFTSVEELLKIKIINSEILHKIAPYLSI
ncbi:MAG: helix-hairpin-helix domain-containing protein [Microscillaceae bacterium]|nr:helix-hairpin-helix domain-containing protein [Microscillaceae bacterium]